MLTHCTEIWWFWGQGKNGYGMLKHRNPKKLLINQPKLGLYVVIKRDTI